MAPPHLITFNGHTRSISDWARVLGLTKQALLLRLKRLPIHEALVYGSAERHRAGSDRRRMRYLVAGEELTAEQIARREGVSTHAVQERARRGLFRKAATSPERRCSICGKPNHYRRTCEERHR